MCSPLGRGVPVLKLEEKQAAWPLSTRVNRQPMSTAFLHRYIGLLSPTATDRLSPPPETHGVSTRRQNGTLPEMIPWD